MRALIIILSVHIFSVHTKLLYYLSPEVVGKASFSYLSLNEATLTAIAFALSYSTGTALTIYTSRDQKLIIVYSILDALGVLLYYFPWVPIETSAFYFAFYTFILIWSCLKVSEKIKPQQQLSEKVESGREPKTMQDLKDQGFTLKQIAEKYNISISTVHRRLKD